MSTSIKNTCLILLCIFTFASCSKDSVVSENVAQFKAVELGNTITYTQMESDVLNAVNDYRQSLGLTTLLKVDEVTFQADDHTVYMSSNEVVNHDNFNIRYSNLVSEAGAKAVAENVAYGYSSADAVVKAWIASEGHHKNMIGDYTHFGISIDKDKNGRNYFTNIFMRR